MKDKNPWRDWYKETVEPEIPELEALLLERNFSRILDLGCGNGRHVIYFARNGFEVYAFDRSEEAIEQARQRLRRENLQADFRVLDMTKPFPYQNDFFDAVIAVRVIQHTYKSDIDKIVNEIGRVLRRGGFLFLQVTSYETGIRDELSKPEPEWVEPGTLIGGYGPEKGVLHHFFRREELLTLLKNYVILDMHVGTEHYNGYCVTARKK